ncbi:MAG: VCBS repeat-containing protein [Planctomycetia bacterium]|nr:VCBS repeat-containing protein [Planctomycetia bacterium]
MSSHIMAVKIENFSVEKRVLIYRKVADLKGKYPKDVVKHALGQTHGANPDILQKAHVGKSALIFSYWYGGQYDGFGGPEAAGGLVRSYTYIDRQLYICYVGNWDGGRCDDPRQIPQKFCGSPERLRAATAEVLAGKEVIIPCVVPDAQNRPTVQRLRASNKLMDYNPKRDFVGFGGDDFTRLQGMPGFAYQTQLPNLGAGVQGISVADLEGNGEAHLCLFGGDRAELLRNFGESLLETSVSGLNQGCRAAIWADYNGDGKPDLLLATTHGPRLHTNLGNGTFRDDSALLPNEAAQNISAAGWLDYDGDGRPDLLLATGFHGLRLYRNLGQAEPVPGAPAPLPAKPATMRWFDDVSTQVGLGPDGIAGHLKGDSLVVADVNGDGRPDVLYGAGSGMLLLNTPRGFVAKTDSGISYQTGGVGPVFADFDNSGALGLFVPQRDGSCKLFKNDGTGRFTDATARAGDLNRSIGQATCAAWGDVDCDGHLDLVVGCLRGPNRYFRNRGDGVFEDRTDAIGLDHRLFNTQAVALTDLNNDGSLDLIFNNEGQSSIALLGDALQARQRTPVVLVAAGKSGVIGSRVKVFDRDGKLMGLREISGGDGRGGQQGPQARFALAPGNYRLEVRSSAGVVRTQEFKVAETPLRAVLAEK